MKRQVESDLLLSTIQAELKKSRHEPCNIEIFLDWLKDVDFLPVMEVFSEIGTSDIEAVDICTQSSCALDGDYALSLMHAIGKKLRIVHIQDTSFGKDFFRYDCLSVDYQVQICLVIYIFCFYWRIF